MIEFNSLNVYGIVFAFDKFAIKNDFFCIYFGVCTVKIKLKPIVAVLSSLGCLAASPAQAMLTASGNGSVLGQVYSFGPTSNATYVSDSGTVSDGAGSSANSDAWGNNLGTYRASASGNGTFDSQGIFNRSLTIANNTGFATQFSLNVFIYYGGLGVNNYAGVNGSGWASYDLDITKNGSVSLFDSYAKIDSQGNLSLSGTALSNGTQYSGGGNLGYYWGGTNVVLNLGLLAAGDSMTIDFDLVSTAHGEFDVVTNSYNCGYGDVGAGGYGGYGGYGGICTSFDTGISYASLGDPSDPNGNTQGAGYFNVSGISANQVPLPGTLSLLGLGLLGLGAFRRTSSRT